MKSTYKLALGIGLLSMAAGSVYAITTPIDISARLRIGLTFTNVTNMNFTPGTWHIDYNGTPANNTDFVTMGGDGARAVVGTVFELSPAGNGTPGSLTINGDDASDVDISCSATATMAAAASSTVVLGVDRLQVSFNTAAAYLAGASNGTVTVCSGVGSGPKQVTLTGTGDDVFIGGRLRGDNTVTTDDYSTANTGGTAMTVQVVYH